MNQIDWLTSTDPHALLEFMTGYNVNLIGHNQPASARKLRLFNCACCRLAWQHLTEQRNRDLVELAERFADGLATTEERRVALYAMPACDSCEWKPEQRVAGHCAFDDGWQQWQLLVEELNARGWLGYPHMAALVREILGNPFRPITILNPWNCRYECKVCGAMPDDEGELRHSRGCYSLSGDGGGSEFFDPKERQPHWLTPTVLGIARAAYNERPGRECVACLGPGRIFDSGNEWKPHPDCRNCHGTGRIEDGRLDPDTLGVLADALSDAGCPEEVECLNPECHVTTARWPTWRCAVCGGARLVPNPILAHLRSPGPHVRGCWAVDLILGKS